MARISRLETRLSPASTGLILFDALNGYLHPKSNPAKSRLLADERILENLTALKKGAERVGATTFFPMGAHAPDGADVVDRLTDTDMELNPLGTGKVIRPGFSRDTWDAEIAEELAPLPTDVRVPKNRWNAFFQTNLELQMRARGITTIVIAGGSTDVGIASTVFAARDLDYGIVVVSDACYSMRGNNNAFFMERVFPRMGRVMTTAEVDALWEA